MKKRLIVFGLVLMIMAPVSVMAKKSGKGNSQNPSPGSSAYEHASDNAKFKRGDDWQGGDGKTEDVESTDDEEMSKEKKIKEKNPEREKKKKGKKGDDESDDAAELGRGDDKGKK